MANLVKLNPDGTLKQYPYSFAELARDFPSTSFPSNLSLCDLADFEAAQVVETPRPSYDYKVNIAATATNDKGTWIETWNATPATPDEIVERTIVQSATIRQMRNKKLADCDWTQLPDAPVDTTAWTVYRQELRDVTKQTEFPWVVAWPIMPEA